jgi:hypothetical protein
MHLNVPNRVVPNVMFIQSFFLTLLTGSLLFTATGAPIAGRRIKKISDESACLMTDNIWKEGK